MEQSPTRGDEPGQLVNSSHSDLSRSTSEVVPSPIVATEMPTATTKNDAYPPPLVAPTPVEKTWRNDKDPIRRRATFSVRYPTLEIFLEKRDDLKSKLPPRFEGNLRRTVKDVRMGIGTTGLTINDCDFLCCQFHRIRDNGESRISGTIFSGCRFEKCFLGGTIYAHVRFDKCVFKRCDFGSAQLVECHFENCTFLECTAEHISISSTEVDPSRLLAGIVAPYYNYGSSFDGEPSPQGLKSEWLRIRKALAAQLVKSNEEIKNSDFSDMALAALKSEALGVQLDNLTHTQLHFGIIRNAGQYIASWVFVKLTKGGTSVARLIIISLVAVTFYSTLLAFSSTTFQGKPCHLDPLDTSAVLGLVTRAAALFFTVGYTAFVGKTPVEDALLTIGAMLGLFWYALIAAVVIRRVYR